MKKALAHRLASLAGMLAMLVATLATPIAAATAVGKRAPTPGLAHTTALGHGPHSQHGSATSAAPSAASVHNHRLAITDAALDVDPQSAPPSQQPCGHSCPSCPDHGSDPAACMLKCFQSAAAPLVAGLRISTPLPSKEPAPASTTVVAGLRVPPLLRPPIV